MLGQDYLARIGPAAVLVGLLLSAANLLFGYKLGPDTFLNMSSGNYNQWGLGYEIYLWSWRLAMLAATIPFVMALARRSQMVPGHGRHLLEVLRASGILRQLIEDYPAERRVDEEPDHHPLDPALARMPLHKRLLWLQRNLPRVCQQRGLHYRTPEQAQNRRLEGIAYAYACYGLLMFSVVCSSIPTMVGATPEALIIFLPMVIPAAIPLWIFHGFYTWLDNIALRLALQEALYGEWAEPKREDAPASDEKDS
jgi:hypothetical protein